MLAEILDDKVLAEVLKNEGSKQSQESVRAEKRKQYQDLFMNRAEKLKVKDLDSFALNSESAGDGTDLIENIRIATIVRRNRVTGSGGGNNILEVFFRGKVKSECPLFLNALLESYKEFLDEMYKNQTTDTVKLFNNAPANC